MARSNFGKSVSEAGLSQLFRFLEYKGAVHAGRRVEAVSNINSTKTCCNCLSRTGPSGRSGLTVRSWVCEICGVSHDRDQNSAMLTLAIGSGLDLKAARQLTGTANGSRGQLIKRGDTSSEAQHLCRHSETTVKKQ